MVRSFLPGSMPVLARRNYALELRAAFFLPMLLSAIEGGVIGVLVRIAYEDAVPVALLNRIVAVIVAAPALANITSFIWVRLSHGRDKIRFIAGLHVALAVAVLGIALMPVNSAGLLGLAGCVIAGRMCWAGFVTLRSTIWGLNYPRSIRARITGKLATVQVLMLAGLGAGLGVVMNRTEVGFRVLFPIGCVIGLVGIVNWSKIRVRGHAAMLVRERNESADDRPSFNPVSMWRVLARDRAYRLYMVCMFLMGTGNLMISAPLVLVMREEFQVGYLQGILIASSIPLVMMPIAIPFWARLLTRTHVISFRALHGWVFVATAALVLVAVRSNAMWLLFLASAIRGFGFGGGALAWTLGHHDFAPPDQATRYMGVHVTLTGVRGLVAPIVGVEFYVLINRLSPGSGSWVFAICLGLILAGTIGFGLLRRAHLAGRLDRDDPIEAAPPSQSGLA